MRRVLLLFALAVLGACAPTSSDAASTTVAPSDPTPSSSTTTTTLSPVEAGSAFVACLGAESVEVPPVAFDEGGAPQLGELAAALDTSDAAVRAAIVACASHLTAAGPTDLADDPEVRLLVDEQLAAFAACMRGEGVEGFPDPGPDGAFALEDVPFAEEAFEGALTTCQAVIGTFGG